MGVVQVLTDVVTREKLGVEGLAEVQASLWPVDCQTCRRPLGQDVPVLCVDDLMVYAVASLHHVACRAPKWRDTGGMAPGPRASTASKVFLLPGAAIVASGGIAGEVPLMLVNPSLEAVLLAWADDRWQVGTVAAYRGLGLRPVGELNGQLPVPGAAATLREGALAVQLTSNAEVECWRCPVEETIAGRAGQLSRVLLGVTTLVRPDEVRLPAEILDLVRAGQVALGWVRLT